jgi:hypothetical protein
MTTGTTDAIEIVIGTTHREEDTIHQDALLRAPEVLPEGTTETLVALLPATAGDS